MNPALAFVRSPNANRKNNNVREPKTTCKARLIENVPINITAVNTPHMARYAPIAVSFEGRGLTYAELNRRANQVAHHLRLLGHGTDCSDVA